MSENKSYKPKSWGGKKKSVGESSEPYEYELPSGDTILVRRISMPQIFALGFVDKLDFFTQALSKELAPEEAQSEEITQGNFMKKLLSNWDQMEDTIDKIIVVGVVEPTVLHNVPDDQRVDGEIYVDTIPPDDKFALFGELLNTEGLSTFRKEPETSVGHVSAEQTLSDAPEHFVGL